MWGGGETPFQTYHSKSREDPLLLALLKDKGVKVQAPEDDDDSSFLPGILEHIFSISAVIFVFLPVLTFGYAVSINAKVQRLLIRAREPMREDGGSL